MTKHHHSNQAHWIGRLLIFILVLVLPGVANSQVVGNGYNNSLIYTIQSDTNEAVASMELTTTEVVHGARLAEDADKLANFRTTYDLDESAVLVGPYGSRLSNGGEQDVEPRASARQRHVRARDAQRRAEDG